MENESVPVTVPVALLQVDQLVPSVLQFSGDFLQYAILFFVLAIVAAILGARGIAGLSMQIAKWLVIIFVVLTIVTLVL